MTNQIINHRLCSVKGCGINHSSRGYCKSHARRFRKYGDPLAESEKSRKYKRNNYIKDGIGFIQLTHGKYTMVDIEDFEEMSKYKWCYCKPKNKRTGYANRQVGGRNNVKTIIMHREIIKAGPRISVDHISHDGLDNRKRNIRKCTASENACNSRKRRGNTSSKYKGVCWHKASNKWMAYINFNKKREYLGLFTYEEYAARAYDIKAKEIFGKFAFLNFPQ